MTCLSCGASTLEGAKFCTQCGAKADSPCRACKQPIKTGQRYCTICGELSGEAHTGPLKHKDAEVAADRRIVTVLFMDVSGFTSMSEKLDPEEVTGIINDFFKVLVEPIYRFGGVVDKYIGDAIMALFGAPLAHEDDPERAVRAAWQMQLAAKTFAEDLEKRTGILLKVRIGLNTGLVVAGAVGGDQRSEYTVMGDTVNLAQRMEANAQVGRVLVTAETYRLTQNAFNYETRDAIIVKGKAELIAVYELVGPKPRTARFTFEEEPLIGRQVELDRLNLDWHDVIGGKAHLTVISGDPGLGKSALADRFLQSVTRDGTQAFWARCLSYEQHTVYATIAGLLHSLLGSPANASSNELQDRLRFLVADMPDPTHTLALLAHLLSLWAPGVPATGTAFLVPQGLESLPPKQIRTAAFMALNDMILHLAQAGPVILALEDLHWSDDASIEWLGSLLDRVSTSEEVLRLHLLCQIRPESGSPIEQMSDRISLTTLSLRPLAATDALALGALQLGSTAEGLPVPVRAVLDQILERAEGNPHYLIEMVRSLAEAGTLVRQGPTWAVAKNAGDAVLPSTVRSAVSARLDRLPAPNRWILQVSSVLGRRFDKALLAAVSEGDLAAHLGELVDQKILYKRPEGEIGFCQAVFQEVAYETLLHSARRDLHRKVAEVIEDREREDLTKAAALLAHHFVKAEDGGRAAFYLFLEGQRARRTYANVEAQIAYRSALAWAEKATDTAHLPDRGEMLLGLASVETMLGNSDAALALLDEVAKAIPPSHQALNARGTALERKGDLGASLLAFREAQALAANEPLEWARATAAIGNVRRRLGQYQEAIALSREAQGALEALGQQAEAGLAHGIMGLCFHRLGDWEGAMREHSAALDLREKSGDVSGIANSLNNLGILFGTVGRWQEANQAYTRSLGLFRRLGDRASMAMALNNLGDLHLKQGDDALAERHFLKSLDLAQQLGIMVEVITAKANLAEVRMARGEGQTALELIDACITQMIAIGNNEFAVELHGARGRALRQLGARVQAESELHHARDMAEKVGNHAFQGTIDRQLAEMAEEAGEVPKALELARRSQGLLQDAGYQLELDRTLALVQRLQAEVDSSRVH